MRHPARLIPTPAEDQNPLDPIDLDGEVVLVGRSVEAPVRIQHASVSRFHARFERRPDGLWLTDLGSSNGTWLNGERISAPTPLEADAELRFGDVRMRLAIDRSIELPAPSAPLHHTKPTVDTGSLGGPAPTVEPAGRPGSRRPRPTTWIAGAALLATLGLGALLLRGVLGGTATTGAAPTGQSAEANRASTPATPTEGPDRPAPGPEADRRPDGSSEREAAPSKAEQVAPPPDPTPRPPRDERVLSLRDGSELRGRVLPSSDAAWISLERRRGQPPERIGRERVVAIDGVPTPPDLRAILKAREAKAPSTRELLDLAAWCEAEGLTEDRLRLAQRVLEIDPNHAGAAAILGRRRYLGVWRSETELREAGIVDSASGLLLGAAEDIRLRRALFSDVWGRPPLPEELTESLSEDLASTVERLLVGPEPWQVWLTEQLVRFAGSDQPHAFATAVGDLPERLANGKIDLREAFRELALCDVVQLSWPEPQDLAQRWLLVILGEGAVEDAELVKAAAGMIRGERTAVLGTRGTTRHDLLDILLAQPNFFRRQYRHEYLRAHGVAPSEDDVRRAAIRLAGKPAEFQALRREWLLSPRRKDLLNSPRDKSVPLLLRGLSVDLLGRPPVPGEEARLRTFAEALGHRELLPAILAPILTQDPLAPGNDFAAPAPSAEALDASVRRHFLHVLGRAPREHEFGPARTVLQSEGVRALRLSLVLSPEYLTY